MSRRRMYPQKKAFQFYKTCRECSKNFKVVELCNEREARMLNAIALFCDVCTPIVAERQKKEALTKTTTTTIDATKNTDEIEKALI